jgi:hypothetical protein
MRGRDSGEPGMTVFANGLEVACKAQSNKVIAAFPYVCMTPPQTPATPPGVPVPYPTFGMDSDTDKGTSTVKIGNQTITQKNKSYYTKCTGNEAGCAPMKNVITHVNKGKEYAHSWSGDVKADGEPVSRFSDLSTNDHASSTAGGAPSKKAGKPGKARAAPKHPCLVGPHKDIQAECAKRKPKSEAHHVIPDMIYRSGSGGRIPGAPTHGEGICICITMTQHKKIHRTVNRNLKALGRATRTLRTPVGRSATVQHTASVGAAAAVASASINDNDIPGLPPGCAKQARDRAMAQTQGISRQPARTNPQRAPKKNSTLQRVLRRGHY